MTDKSIVGVKHTPKGQAYCDVAGTSCCYDDMEVCINCFRTKGWRQHKRKTDAIARSFQFTPEQKESLTNKLQQRREEIERELRQVEEALDILRDTWYEPLI
jgi:hypothetical protein